MTRLVVEGETKQTVNTHTHNKIKPNAFISIVLNESCLFIVSTTKQNKSKLENRRVSSALCALVAFFI